MICSLRDPGLARRVRRFSIQVNALFSTVILIIVCTVFKSAAEKDVFTDQFVLHHSGGPDQASRFAREQGFVYLDQIFADHYHLRHHSVSKRSLAPHPDHHLKQMVSNHSQVHSLRQQKLKSRAKRDFQKLSPNKNEIHKRFDDPRWAQMWYLNRGQGLDMNVESVWDKNITGRGVVVTILDDGLEKNHPDLVSNYDPDASYDVNNQDGDPMPRYDMIDSNRHGTRCAGEVAASANNSFCAVGVAFDARIGGVRMLDGDVTDAVEARSLSLNPQHIQIYSASWGPDDDGKTVDGPGELATRAFMDGVAYGRGGLGSIFVWASGNGGREHDNCNCDGYTNSIWTLSISSATENGLVPWYSEACSSTLATTYSSGSFGERQIVTTDLHHACTSSHTGTSASAPLAAGICALALESNRNLTWRDMQHVVVQAAHQGNLHARDWRTNGVGRNVSHSFGYGLLDADAMVQIAKDWVTVPPQKVCEVESHPIDKLIPAKSHVEMSLHVNCDNVRFLEHVQAKVTLTATRRGDIHIYLTSPSGTRSTLLAQRPMDNSRSGFQKWPFMSVHSWGENPNGEWKIEVHNEGRFYSGGGGFPSLLGRAYLKEWSLILHGTAVHPDRRKKKARMPTSRVAAGIRTPVKAPPRPPAAPGTVRRDPDSRVPSDPFASNVIEDELISGSSRNSHNSGSGYTLVHGTRAHKSDDEVNRMPGQAVSRGCISSSAGDCLGCANGFYLLRGRCVTLCPDGFFPFDSARSSCLKCHYSCRSCLTANNCTSCFSDAELHRSRCYAKELVDEVVELEKWYTAVSVVFLCLCFVILVLVVYIITDKNPQLFRCTANARVSTSFLTRDRRQQTQVLKLDGKKRQPVAPIYSDDYNSEEDL